MKEVDLKRKFLSFTSSQKGKAGCSIIREYGTCCLVILCVSSEQVFLNCAHVIDIALTSFAIVIYIMYKL